MQEIIRDPALSGRTSRLALLLVALTLVLTLSVACGSSGNKDDPPDRDTWDDLKWDEGVWAHTDFRNHTSVTG